MPVKSLINFLQEVRLELEKVTWPTRQQTIRMTVVVLIVTVFMAAFIGGLDFVFTKFFGFLIST